MLKRIIGDADLADFESLDLDENIANINPDPLPTLPQPSDLKMPLLSMKLVPKVSKLAKML